MVCSLLKAGKCSSTRTEDDTLKDKENEVESSFGLEVESELLDDKKAREFEDSDPSLKDQNLWQPP